MVTILGMTASDMTGKLYDNLPSIVFTLFVAIALIGIISGTAKADLNGTELLEDPVNTTLSPFMKFYTTVTGNPMNFFIIPLAGIAVGLYVNSDDYLIPCMYMVGSGALFSSASIFGGMPGIPFLFLIFTGIGITGVFINLYFGMKG